MNARDQERLQARIDRTTKRYWKLHLDQWDASLNRLASMSKLIDEANGVTQDVAETDRARRCAGEGHPSTREARL